MAVGSAISLFIYEASEHFKGNVPSEIECIAYTEITSQTVSRLISSCIFGTCKLPVEETYLQPVMKTLLENPKQKLLIYRN